jgi:hypothetical protein
VAPNSRYSSITLVTGALFQPTPVRMPLRVTHVERDCCNCYDMEPGKSPSGDCFPFVKQRSRSCRLRKLTCARARCGRASWHFHPCTDDDAMLKDAQRVLIHVTTPPPSCLSRTTASDYLNQVACDGEGKSACTRNLCLSQNPQTADSTNKIHR